MTSSIKWEPIEDLKALRDLLSRTFVPPVRFSPLSKLFGWDVPVDLYETEEAYVALLDVPGLAAGDLHVAVSGSKLTVGGERQEPEEDEEAEGEACVYAERPMGKFSRTLSVPDGVDVDRISAKLASGVLTLTMPKGAEVEKVTVEVKPRESLAVKASANIRGLGAKLSARRQSLQAFSDTQIVLKPNSRQSQRSITTAMDEGQLPKVRIKVELVDGVGNRETARFRVKLKR